MARPFESQRPGRRTPDRAAAAAAGFAAGAILMLLDLFWANAVVGASPWTTSRMIAAIFMGPAILQDSGFGFGVVALALAVHYTLGVLSGIVLVAISNRLRLDTGVGIATLTGVVFGLVIYVVNFHALARLFPWFAETRGVAAVAAHLIFGMSIALLYWKLERRGPAGGAAQRA
jgi:hypothetical protein